MTKKITQTAINSMGRDFKALLYEYDIQKGDVKDQIVDKWDILREAVIINRGYKLEDVRKNLKNSIDNLCDKLAVRVLNVCCRRSDYKSACHISLATKLSENGLLCSVSGMFPADVSEKKYTEFVLSIIKEAFCDFLIREYAYDIIKTNISADSDRTPLLAMSYKEIEDQIRENGVEWVFPSYSGGTTPPSEKICKSVYDKVSGLGLEYPIYIQREMSPANLSVNQLLHIYNEGFSRLVSTYLLLHLLGTVKIKGVQVDPHLVHLSGTVFYLSIYTSDIEKFARHLVEKCPLILAYLFYYSNRYLANVQSPNMKLFLENHRVTSHDISMELDIFRCHCGHGEQSFEFNKMFPTLKETHSTKSDAWLNVFAGWLRSSQFYNNRRDGYISKVDAFFV